MNIPVACPKCGKVSIITDQAVFCGTCGWRMLAEESLEQVIEIKRRDGKTRDLKGATRAEAALKRLKEENHGE